MNLSQRCWPTTRWLLVRMLLKRGEDRNNIDSSKVISIKPMRFFLNSVCRWGWRSKAHPQWWGWIQFICERNDPYRYTYQNNWWRCRLGLFETGHSWPHIDCLWCTYFGLDGEQAPEDVTEEIIHTSVTVIKEDAFWRCHSLVRVTMLDASDYLVIKNWLGHRLYMCNSLADASVI